MAGQEEVKAAQRKRGHSYLQSLNYASYFNARRSALDSESPSEDTPSSTVASRIRRRFNPFHISKVATIDENKPVEPSDGRMAGMVANLGIESTDGQRSKKARSSSDSQADSDDAASHDPLRPQEFAGESKAEDEMDTAGTDDKALCSSMSCMPAAKIGLRIFGREISNCKTPSEWSELKATATRPLRNHGDSEVGEARNGRVGIGGDKAQSTEQDSVYKAQSEQQGSLEAADLQHGDEDAVNSRPALSVESAQQVPQEAEASAYQAPGKIALLGDPQEKILNGYKFSKINNAENDVIDNDDDHSVKAALEALAAAQAQVTVRLAAEAKQLAEMSAAHERRAAEAQERKGEVSRVLRIARSVNNDVL